MRIAFVLAAALLVAGCLASDTPTTTTDPATACPASGLDQPGLRLVDPTVDPINDGKENATDFASYNIRTCSLPAVGWSALRFAGDGTPMPHLYLGELDMRGDLNLGAVAVVGSGEPGGVYIVDITNRTNPAPLSYIAQPGAHVTDVKISDDGAVLYVASQNIPQAELTDTLPEPVAPTGFTVYSLADPSAPAYLGTVVDPSVGCHMLDPVEVAPGQDAVFCISQHLRSYLIDRSQGVVVNLGFVDYVPTRDGVPTPGSIPAVGDPSCNGPVAEVPDAGLCLLAQAPHDMTAYHPSGAFGEGSLMIVSHWGEGLKVLDISQAPLITEVASWNGEGATHYAGNVHTAMMFEVGAKRYIVATPELTFGGVIPGIWVLDATDLAQLKLVGQWYHPGNHTSQGLFLTTHQWQVAPVGPDVAPHDVRIYLTYNHAGLWVLDLGAILEDDAQGAILGFNLARMPIPEEPTPVANAILNTWDVNVVDGVIYGTDRATGLWAFHYQGDEMGDERLRGFA